MIGKRAIVAGFVAVLSAGLAVDVPAQGPRRGRGPDSDFPADRAVFHFLLQNHKQIRRTVKNRSDGVETLTESDNSRIAAKIREHVKAMYRRVDKNRPIHRRDPLFAELFRHAGKITMTVEDTKTGVRVIETSKDPYTVRLIQAHAKVVSAFVKNGHVEVQKDHALPAQPRRQTNLDSSVWKALPTKAREPKDNPTTPAKVELGKKLYFDPRISSTGTVSCNSCHNVMEGGDDGRMTSMGILGKTGGRNAPTVWNSAFNSVQFWDGRAPTLEDQAKGPIVNPVEMGMPTHDLAVDRLKDIPGYRKEFTAVFGGKNSLNIENVVKAIAAFERTLITPDSPYDRYVKEDATALTAQQVRGMKSFHSIGCTSCHSGPAFNGRQFDLPLGQGHYEQFPVFSDNEYVKKYKLQQDKGRFDVTQKENDKHRYKVALLRNITLTAPYFHNGSVATLEEAVRVMAVTQLATQLSDRQVNDIVAFLGALTGRFPEITLPRIPSKPGASVLMSRPISE